jgi:predicted permease
MPTLLRRLWYLFRRHRVDADLAEELAFHRAMKAREIEADGTSPADAAIDARRALGNTASAHDRVHDVWITPWLQDLLREPRIACRSLLKSPGISITTIILIALVVGGNTTIYSAVHGLLTKPAPGVQADGLVTLDTLRNGEAIGSFDSYPNYQDYVAQSTSIRPLAAIGVEPFTLTLHDGSYAVRGDLVTPNYFETLGVRLAMGRTFGGDEGTRGSDLTAVISDRLWREPLQSAADIVGRHIVLSGHPATIIGVAPPAFRGTGLGESADVWVPLLAYSRLDSSGPASEVALNDRGAPRLVLLGRLAPGVSLAAAQAELNAVTARLQAAYPKTNGHQSIRLLPYSMTAGGNSLLIASIPRFLAIFTVVTILTLLIVCANIANLMLARAVVRQREMAVRQSLGASRVRILRMLLAESILLSLAAWAAALLFAGWVSHALVRLLRPPPAFASDFAFTVRPDWTVAGYALALALFAMIAFTVGPSLRAWRQDLLPWLKAGEQGVVQGRSRLAAALVVLQLACSILLLVGAGLAYRSLSLLSGRNLGFDPEGVLVVTVNTSGSATSEGTNKELLDRLQTRLGSVPGVESVSYARRPVNQYWPPVRIRSDRAQQSVVAEQNEVGPGFLAVHGVRPRAGRDFTMADADRGQRAAVITQNLADALWPGQSAIGRSVRLGSERQPIAIIGIAPNALFHGFSVEEDPKFIFLSEPQNPVAPGLTRFYFRYRGSLDAIAPAIRRALVTTSASTSIVTMDSLASLLDADIQPIRMVTILLVLFALGSLLVAGIGQYAVIAFDMRRRTRELGVRIALGASARQIATGVIQEGLRLTAAGLVFGFVLSLAAGMALRRLLYGVTPTDAWTYAGVFVLLACASFAACYLPARRAARVDPVRTLRQE